jgi:hypothetical protein
MDTHRNTHKMSVDVDSNPFEKWSKGSWEHVVPGKFGGHLTDDGASDNAYSCADRNTDRI